MLASGSNALIILAIVVGLVLHAAMYAPQAAFIAELFPTRIRYSGVSIAYQLTAIFAGVARADHRAVAVQGPALVGAGLDLRRHRLRDQRRQRAAGAGDEGRRIVGDSITTVIPALSRDLPSLSGSGANPKSSARSRQVGFAHESDRTSKPEASA